MLIRAIGSPITYLQMELLTNSAGRTKFPTAAVPLFQKHKIKRRAARDCPTLTIALPSLSKGNCFSLPESSRVFYFLFQTRKGVPFARYCLKLLLQNNLRTSSFALDSGR